MTPAVLNELRGGIQGICAEMTRAELDLVIMGQLVASSEIVSAIARHNDDDRGKRYTNFTHQGKPVCQDVLVPPRNW